MALRLKMSAPWFEAPFRVSPLSLRAALLGLGLFAGSAPAAASEAPISESPVLIVEEEAPSLTESTSHSADAIDLTSLAGSGQSVADAIEHLPGVHLRRTGGFGSFTSLGMRGLGMRYVNVVVNNTALHLTGTGGVDLSLLPLEHIERVEVFRGGGPLQFEAPLGGVLRIVTKLPKNRSTLHAHLGYGSYHSRSAHLASGGPLPGLALRYHATLTRQDTSGRFPFWNDNATLYTPADDFSDVRRNNALELTTANFTLEGDGPGSGLWDLTVTGHQRQSQQPGPKPQRGTPVPTAQASDQGISLRGELRELESANRRVRGGAQLYAATAHRKFLSDTPRPGLDVRSVTAQFSSAGLGGQWEHRRGHLPVLRIALGVGWQGMTQRSPDSEGPGLGGDLDFQELHPFLAVELPRVLSPSLQLLPTLRLDTLLTPESSLEDLSIELSPKLGAIWEVGGGTLRANLARHHRAPGFEERFGDGLNTAPSPHLTAERGVLLDLGYRRPLQGLRTRLEAGLFLTQIHDLIALLPTSQRYVRAHNLSSQRLLGVELAAESRLSHLTAGVNYTFIYGRGESSRQTPGVPAHRLDLNLGITVGEFSLTYQPGYQSSLFLDPDNRLALPHRLLHNLTASLSLPSLGLLFKLHGRNLGDSQSAPISLPGGIVGRATVGDYLGYPLPGRSLFGSCSFKI